LVVVEVGVPEAALVVAAENIKFIQEFCSQIHHIQYQSVPAEKTLVLGNMAAALEHKVYLAAVLFSSDRVAAVAVARPIFSVIIMVADQLVVDRGT
jgi:hypothetical protein